MPTYEYECKTCNHTFEVFQSMSDDPIKICPECGKEVRRLINGGTGIIFKGSGFYVTDKSGSKSSSLIKSTKSGDTATVTPGDKSSSPDVSPPTTSEKKVPSAPAKAAES